jgi:hypothetical protein
MHGRVSGLWRLWSHPASWGSVFRPLEELAELRSG